MSAEGESVKDRGRAVLRVTQVLLAGYVLLRFGLFAQYCASVISYPFEICAGEGILLNQGRLWAMGEAIYRPVGAYPLLISHFPPVVPGLLALGVKAFGIAFWPGRTLSFLSAVAMGLAVFKLCEGPRWIKAVAGLLLAASPWIMLGSVETCVDTFAAALSLWGVCVASRRRGAGWDVAAGALFAAAVLTRQTAVAGLAAVVWWLWPRDRRACLRVVLAAGIPVVLAVVWLDAATGGEFHRHVVSYTKGRLSLLRLWLFARAYVWTHWVLLGLACVYVWRQARERRLGLLLRYLIVAHAVAATCARQGSGQTYFLVAIAVTCAAAGSAMGWLWASSRAHPRLVAFAAVATVLCLEVSRRASDFPARPTQEQKRQTDLVLGKLKRIGPPILSEYSGLVLQAGGDLLFQPYAFRMLAAAGGWKDYSLVEDIRRGRFRAIVMDRTQRGRWTPGVYAAVEQAYAVAGRYEMFRHIGPVHVLLLLPRDRVVPGLAPVQGPHGGGGRLQPSLWPVSHNP